MMRLKEFGFILTASHYWMPQLYSFLIAIQIINSYENRFYSLYSTSVFYIAVFGAFFSAKPFSLLVSRKKSYSIELDQSRIFFLDMLFRMFGLVFAIFACHVFSSDFNELKTPMYFISYIALLKIIDPFLEYKFLSLDKIANLGKARIFFYSSIFLINSISIQNFNEIYFLIIYAFFSTVELFAKWMLIRTQLNKNHKHQEITIRNKEEAWWLFPIQNILSVSNKNFDILFIVFLSGNIAIYSTYLFCRQVHNAFMTVNQPINHILFQKKGNAKTTHILAVVILVATGILSIAVSETFILFIKLKNFDDVLRQFYFIWFFYLISIPFPIIFIKHNVFQYQTILSLICFFTLIAAWWIHEFALDVDTLLDIRLITAIVSTTGQLLIYLFFVKKGHREK